MNSIPCLGRLRPSVCSLRLAVTLAALIGISAVLQAQTIVTNYMNFSDFAGTQGAQLDTQNVQGMPAGITATWGWQFILVDDFGNYLPPSTSAEGIDCRASSVVTFSSPVVIWSMAAVRLQWGPTMRLVGKLAGTTVWIFDSPGTQYAWQSVTNGAYQPIDTLEFDCEDWNTRYTDIYISDATGITPPTPPLVTFFESSPPTPQFLRAGTPVQLTWLVRPGATVSIDQGVGDVTSMTDATGNGAYQFVTPMTNTTYTITSQDGTNTATAQVTLEVKLTPGIGLLTFEDQPPVETALPASYNWNAPAGVNISWQGWSLKPSSYGTPTTANDIYPIAALLPDGTNNAMIDFTDTNGTPTPAILNSFQINKVPDSWGWGPVYIEGRLQGVVQWTVTTNDLVDWENFVTKGAGIPVDEVAFQGKWYQYDNFAISTTNAPAQPINLFSSTSTGGQFQFSWDSTTAWPYFFVFKQNTVTDAWYRASGLVPSAGATNSYSEAATAPGFFRVMRYP